MNYFYIITILYAIAAISLSSGEEAHAEEPNDKTVKSTYTYSIQYSDSGNHGNYGHKIEVTDGNAKVNVHSEHPQNEGQLDQPKIRTQSRPNHAKHQVLAYIPHQETKKIVPHHKEEHNPGQVVQVQKTQPTGKLPIETLDKHQLAVLLAQNKNPFLPLTEHKDVKHPQSQKASVPKNTSPEHPQTVSYYVPQGQNNYQTPVQPSKHTYTNPKVQYTYQYQPGSEKSNLVYDSKIQYASVPQQQQQQQQYYYPETSQLNNNQIYQNYYQHQIPTANVQPQVQYTVPFTQQYHQEQPQQYVYLPQAAPQTSNEHAQQYSFGHLQGSNQQGGPVQFLPPQQSQNSHTYPTTPLYNIPKAVNIPSGAPELNAYPASLFSNVQYGTSIYGPSAAYGTQTNIGYKPVVEASESGKANQYESFPGLPGNNYGAAAALNNIPSGLFKTNSVASVPVQDTKSSNFYATAANVPQGVSGKQFNTEHLAQAYQQQGPTPNTAYHQPTAQQSIDYSQFGQTTNQIQYPAYYSNQISNVKQPTAYLPVNSKTNVPFIPSKQITSHAPETAPTYVKVQKSINFGTNVPQYYNPNAGVKHAENNVRYVYVQANGVPIPEQSKVGTQ